MVLTHIFEVKYPKTLLLSPLALIVENSLKINYTKKSKIWCLIKAHLCSA